MLCEKGFTSTAISFLPIVLPLWCLSLAASEGQIRQIEALGGYRIGSNLAEVRHLKRSENCVVEETTADCAFTDRDGFEYVVFGDIVNWVRVSRESARDGVRLPFGLTFGDPMSDAVDVLTEGNRDWFVTKERGTSKNMFISEDRYYGKGNLEFFVEVKFDEGVLVAMHYRTESPV